MEWTFTKFYYCSSTDIDKTIRQAQANKKITDLLSTYGIETQTIFTGASGHANTAAAARVIGPILAARYGRASRIISV